MRIERAAVSGRIVVIAIVLMALILALISRHYANDVHPLLPATTEPASQP